MLILSANALNGKLDLQFDDPQDKQAVGSFWSILSGLPSTAGYLLSDRNGVSSGKARI